MKYEAFAGKASITGGDCIRVLGTFRVRAILCTAQTTKTACYLKIYYHIFYKQTADITKTKDR